MHYWTLSVVKVGDLPVADPPVYLLRSQLPDDPTNEQLTELLRRAGWPVDKKLRLMLSEPWEDRAVIDFNAELAKPADEADVAKRQAAWNDEYYERDATPADFRPPTGK